MNPWKSKACSFSISWELCESLVNAHALIILLVTGHQHAYEPVGGLADRVESFFAVASVCFDSIARVTWDVN